MKCTCGNKLELQQYTRVNENGNPELTYECPNDECYQKPRIWYNHLPPIRKRTKKEERELYLKHTLELAYLLEE